MNNITKALTTLILEPIQDEVQKTKNLEQIKLLLKHHNEYKKIGLNLLEIDFNHINRVSVKVDEKTQIDEKQTLLDMAILMNKIEVVKLLIQEGMDPNSSLSTTPPLSLAAKKNSTRIIKFLLDSGANIDNFDQNSFNKNALFVACSNNSYEAIRVLLLNNSNCNLLYQGKKTAIDYIPNDKEESIKLMKAALSLQKAIDKLAIDGDIFAASSNLNTAFNSDPNFVLSYMVEMIKVTNLRVQGIKHNEKYYHPQILRLAIKNLKTFANTFPDFIANHFPEGIVDFLKELNGYDVEQAVNNEFHSSELLFKTTEEKAKTLRWFEKGTTFEAVKSGMQEKKYSLIDALVRSESPIYTPPKVVSKSEVKPESESTVLNTFD